MIELYEGFKQMLRNHRQEVIYEKEEFNKTVKGLTKEAKLYKLQLEGYEDEINRNIQKINNKIAKLKLNEKFGKEA